MEPKSISRKSQADTDWFCADCNVHLAYNAKYRGHLEHTVVKTAEWNALLLAKPTISIKKLKKSDRCELARGLAEQRSKRRGNHKRKASLANTDEHLAEPSLSISPSARSLSAEHKPNTIKIRNSKLAIIRLDGS